MKVHEFALAIAAATSVSIMSIAAAESPAADALVVSVRNALGGAKRIESIQGLSVVADVRRMLPGADGSPSTEISGEVRLDLGGEGDYLFVDSFSPMAGMPPIEIGSGLDQGEPWTAALKTPGGHVMIRLPQSSDPGTLKARLEEQVSRFALAFLAGSRTGIELTDAGEASAPEGKARVIAVKGVAAAPKLLVDAKTSLPLMILYKDTPRAVARRLSPTSETAAPPPLPSRVDARLFLSDFKKLDGLSFPYKLVAELDGGQTEEWTVREIKVNPKFGANHFKKRS